MDAQCCPASAESAAVMADRQKDSGLYRCMVRDHCDPQPSFAKTPGPSNRGNHIDIFYSFNTISDNQSLALAVLICFGCVYGSL